MKFGIIGTGKIVRRFLNAGSCCRDMEAAVFYSRKKEHAEEFAQSQGLKNYRTCDSLENLSADPDVEAVYVASPTYAHCRQSVLMLNAGKHVLCEKPAASNYQEWRQMQEAAARTNCVVMEAMRPIFTPAFAAIKENLKKVGTVRKVFIQYCQYSSRYDNFKKGIVENAFRPELSNGALMDIGIYCLEVMVALFGPPTGVTANAHIIPGSIDASGSVLAQYPEMQAILSYSKIVDSVLPCEIQGEKGSLLWEGAGTPENVYFVPRSGEKEKIYGSMPLHDMSYEQEEFISFCKEGKYPEEYNKITAECLKLTDEIRRQCGIVFPADKI